MKIIKEMFNDYINQYLGYGVYKHMTDQQKGRIEHAYLAGCRDTTKLFETIMKKQAG
jgi:hypothetical protein